METWFEGLRLMEGARILNLGHSLCEGEGVRSTLLQGYMNSRENQIMAHVKLCENHDFHEILKNTQVSPDALRNVQGPSRKSMVTPGHALGV